MHLWLNGLYFQLQNSCQDVSIICVATGFTSEDVQVVKQDITGKMTKFYLSFSRHMHPVAMLSILTKHMVDGTFASEFGWEFDVTSLKLGDCKLQYITFK